MKRVERNQGLDMEYMLHDILQLAIKADNHEVLSSRLNDADRDLDYSKCCLPGTRVAILEQIQQWAIVPGAERALLLYGVAGKGKSTIIHTICRELELERTEKSPLATVVFFAFERSVANRSIPQLLHTWAWNLASRDPQYLAYLCALERPKFRGSSEDQLVTLFIQGLNRADRRIPIVFGIDALDECPEPRSLLKLLRRLLSSDLPQHCRFVFTCRPDGDILEKLNCPPLVAQISLGDKQWHTVDDIRVFVHEKLDGWPDVASLVDLVTLAAEGVFQCAALLCAELMASRARSLVDAELFIGRLKDGAFKSLYDTYGQVLKMYIDPRDDLLVKAFKHLMASIFLVRSPQHHNTLMPLAAATVSRERQLDMETREEWSALDTHVERPTLETILHFLGSLLSGSTFDLDKVPVLPLHTSFRDFLVDSPESGVFSVDIGPRHEELLALACLDITNAQLRFNMCDFDTSYKLNSEIEGLQERAEKIAPELKYACRYAAYHLDKSLGGPDEQVKPAGPQKPRTAAHIRLDAALSYFLKNRFLYWLEVHSCMGSQQDGPGGMLPRFQKWASARSPGELVSILADFIKFEKRFRDGYMRSAPQVYYSGLTFSPEVSKVRELYKGPFYIPTTAIKGRERMWPTTETLVIGSGDQTIRIWDAATGQQVGDALTGHEDSIYSVAFSPDGAQIVSGSDNNTIRIWDAVTGQQLEDTSVNGQRAAFSDTFSNKVNGHGDHMRANAASYRHGCAILHPLVRNAEWIYDARDQRSPSARILWIPPVF
ncbi:hypothetical protein HGRIS_001493 [Hohenbuehelia grisea]|uniref:NACHT domain-containing protein n=1 Tax=Hohenbuehelia grisea TaxID=104357 RepID=A0ABR3JR09_9AGAR